MMRTLLTLLHLREPEPCTLHCADPSEAEMRFERQRQRAEATMWKADALTRRVQQRPSWEGLFVPDGGRNGR